MYVLHKRERTVRMVNGPHAGETRTEPGETRTFTTAAGMLGWLLRTGVLRPQHHRAGEVKYFGDIYLGRTGQRTYGLVAVDSRWEITYDHIEAMRGAQERYAQIVHFLREVDPQWRPDTSVSETGKVYYADNSTELHEVNRYGGTRRRVLVAPHGDACF